MKSTVFLLDIIWKVKVFLVFVCFDFLTEHQRSHILYLVKQSS